MLEQVDTRGVFGSQAGLNLKRLPSDVYWSGLQSWGIREFSGHKWAYFRSLDEFYRKSDLSRSTPHDPEGGGSPPANWHPHLPAPPSGFPDGDISVELRRKDAEYLRDRIQARHSNSLLALLAGRADPADLGADQPWELSRLSEATPVLREHLHDAKMFAVCMQGAALLYNLMLSELQGHEVRQETYRDELQAWADDVEALGSSLSDWQPDGIWSVVRDQGRSVGYPTQTFVESWIEALKRGGSKTVVRNNIFVRALVRQREISIKRGRARLESPRHLELWGGRSGTRRLNFRWGDSPMAGTRMILRDIFDGLKRSQGDAGDA